MTFLKIFHLNLWKTYQIKNRLRAFEAVSVVRDFRTVQLFATGGVLPRGSVNNLPVFGSCQRLKPGTLCASTKHCKQSLYVEPAGISGVTLPMCSVTQPQALHSRKYRLDLVMVIFCEFILFSFSRQPPNGCSATCTAEMFVL